MIFYISDGFCCHVPSILLLFFPVSQNCHAMQSCTLDWSPVANNGTESLGDYMLAACGLSLKLFRCATSGVVHRRACKEWVADDS